jgi:hypothetical protein
MKNIALAVLAGFLAGCSTMPPLPDPQDRRDLAAVVIESWYNYSKVAALNLISEYGAPDAVEAGRLVWNDKGPWKRIAVWDVVPYYDSNTGPNNLEMTLAYAVTPAQAGALKEFDRRVRVTKGGSELSARCDREELNFLALNLADEVVNGVKSPAQARDFFARTVELAAEGRSSRYMQGLLFSPNALAQNK